MNIAIESVRRLVTQVPGWQLGLFGCVALYAIWRHKLLHLLAALAFCFYLWIVYQYAMMGFATLNDQTVFGLLVGGGIVAFMMMIYFMVARDGQT
ncbi:MAG: hypothetical protein GXP25_18740 [Planctomycetes bacterium]|nr:hypothetical protein [Planctomycetota bacterium]